MRPHEHERMHEVETRHFWFRGTRRVIVAALERALGTGRAAQPRVLDLGCGTGFTLTQLPAGMRVVGLDASPTAVAFARRRAPGAAVVRGSAYELPFADGSFDAVLALDVLEHLEDDGRASRELLRVLKAGGVGVFTVPAFEALWSAHDEALDHQRRYRLEEFEGVLRHAGFEISHGTYYNFFLFPAVVLTRWADKLRATRGASGTDRADLDVPSAGVNAALTAILGAERWIAPRIRLPFGVSCLVIAKRPRPATHRAPSP